MINLRKVVALDMLLHGTRFILAEFAFGIFFLLILGVISIWGGLSGPVRIGWEAGLGFWLIGIGLNYVPLFIYAVLIAGGHTITEEGQPELPRVKRYSIHQVLIFVPLLFLVAALMQEGRRRR